MNDDVATDLRCSSWAFKNLVWPEIEGWCGYGRLKLVEDTTARGLAKELDTLAGIDAWQLLDNRGFMRGIASRVQRRPEPYRSFTIRYRRYGGATTEFEKRLSAIRDRDAGALFPALTVQAYVQSWERGPLVAAAVVRTIDMFEHLTAQFRAGRARPRYVHERGCNNRDEKALRQGCVQGCAEFYPVWWDALRQAGLRAPGCPVWPDDAMRRTA